jgi:CRISPR-associated protein Csb2
LIAVEIDFITGRFHATPWGRHVNEGEPEWPPSPYRLLRGLVDTWLRKRADWKPERVEPILRTLAEAAPEFYLPSARSAHTRSYLSENKPDPTGKQKVFDAFVLPAGPVHVLWADKQLSASQSSDLGELLELMNYLGRSESWVKARLIETPTSIPNCLPSDETSAQQDTILVACPTSVITPMIEKIPSSEVSSVESSPWLDALCWTTDKQSSLGFTLPPVLHMRAYGRPRDCFQGTMKKSQRLRTSQVQTVLYALDSKVPPLLTETLEVAERFRRIVMGCHRKLLDSNFISPNFSGKTADGSPLRGHKHCYFLPLDLNRDGKLDHFAVTCNKAFTQTELAALDRVRQVWQRKNKPEVNCIPIVWADSPAQIECFRPSTIFESSTPYIPTHHHRKGRGNFSAWLVEHLAYDLERLGYPRPLRIDILSELPRKGRPIRWLEFRRNRKGSSPRQAFGFRLEFSEPVVGPIVAGYNAHFGLGLFLPKR